MTDTTLYTPATSRHARLCTLVGSLATVLTLCLTLAAPSASANTGPPTVTKIEAIELHSTRTEIQSDMCANGSPTHYAIEYAQAGGELSWKLAGEGTIESAGGNECSATETARHLLPGAAYAIRIIGRNAFGSAIEEGHFTTPPIEPAEILFFGIEKAGEFGPEFANVELEVEDNGAPSTSYEVKLSKQGGPFEAVAGGSGSVSQAEDAARRVVHIEGLTPSTQYTVQLAATNGVGSAATKEFSFKTKPATPEAGCCAVSAVHSSSVHLAGQVGPDDSATTWRLQVASSPTAPDGEWSLVSEGLLTGSEADATFHEVQGDASGLAEGKAYYARVVAENAHGAVTSEVKSFETAGVALVSTFETHAIHGESLRALGDVRPDGNDTHFYVEYVTQQQFEETGFANAASTPEEDAGPGEPVAGVFPTVIVGQDLSGLAPGTTYHYRLVAKSSASAGAQVDGNEQTLTVPGVSSSEAPACANEALRAGLSVNLPDCRAYEQVTPVEKGGAQDFSHYGLVTMGANVGEDGEHMMLHVPGTQWGSSPDATVGEYYFNRTPAGWGMTSTRPVGEAGPNSFQAQLFSPDLTQIAVEANWATGD
ncbi:MAG TPA: fibronectin type III domain-containing protein, partial [Solirubrobacteraceae bacterium]|nr:fibronectin type III domain-containing protein [Solirubrobacteraceae bacterium]